MGGFAEDIFYVVKWKGNKNGGRVDVLTKKQYEQFEGDVDLIKQNKGYEPALKIMTAGKYQGGSAKGFCA